MCIRDRRRLELHAARALGKTAPVIVQRQAARLAAAVAGHGAGIGRRRMQQEAVQLAVRVGHRQAAVGVAGDGRILAVAAFGRGGEIPGHGARRGQVGGDRDLLDAFAHRDGAEGRLAIGAQGLREVLADVHLAAHVGQPLRGAGVGGALHHPYIDAITHDAAIARRRKQAERGTAGPLGIGQLALARGAALQQPPRHVGQVGQEAADAGPVSYTHLRQPDRDKPQVKGTGCGSQYRASRTAPG